MASQCTLPPSLPPKTLDLREQKTKEPSLQKRVKQIFLISDKTTEFVLRYLTSRDSSYLATEFIELAEFELNPFANPNPFKERQDDRDTLFSIETFSPTFDLVSLSRLDRNMASSFFWIPIFVLTDPENAEAAIMSEEEVDEFNRDRVKEAQSACAHYQSSIKWNRILLNPNKEIKQYAEIHPLSKDVDPGLLKHMGAHLANLDESTHDTDFGFELIVKPQRAALHNRDEEC
jgi:hypothetical protein